MLTFKVPEREVVFDAPPPRAAVPADPPKRLRKVGAVAAAPRILDFDTESRPLAFLGSDHVTQEITCIAWSWIGSGETDCRWLSKRQESARWMLREFASVYAEADIVTGHNIRGHDLPILNGAMVELGLSPLGKKRVLDTWADLIRFRGISKSQENLAAVLGVDAPKVGMNQVRWREANRLTPAGLRLTAERCMGDVEQHIELRRVLLDRKMLRDEGRPRWWLPTTR